MSNIVLGSSDFGAAQVRIDVERLRRTQLLLNANSGGGKSRTLRRMAEQLAHQHEQVIIVDLEGEFSTLREKYDFVLVGEGGEAVATVQSAGLLAHRLLEIGQSAVCDLSELSPADKHRWAAAFFRALVDAPKKLWRDLFIMVDEAHILAPEKGHGESAALDPLCSLASRGRKRSYCTIMATQRLGKLSKDAAAELQNVLVGKTFMDIDAARALLALSVQKSDIPETRRKLKLLKPGQFYALGTAVSEETVLVQVGDVQTTHPEPGRRRVAPPPPPEKVRALLAQLADLPQEAENKARSETELKAEVARLRGELAVAAKKAVPAVPAKVIEKSVVKPADLLRIEKLVEKLEVAEKLFHEKTAHLTDLLAQRQQAVVSELGNLVQAIKPTQVTKGLTYAADDVARRLTGRWSSKQPNLAQAPKPSNGAAPRSPQGLTQTLHATRVATDDLPVGERALLITCAQHDSTGGCTRAQLTGITGYKRSTRDRYLQYLIQKRCVTVSGDRIRITHTGLDILGSYEPLPVGDALLQYWLRELPQGEAAILKYVASCGYDGTNRDAITEVTGYKRSTRDRYLQYLSARELVETGGVGVRAVAELFD